MLFYSYKDEKSGFCPSVATLRFHEIKSNNEIKFWNVICEKWVKNKLISVTQLWALQNFKSRGKKS